MVRFADPTKSIREPMSIEVKCDTCGNSQTVSTKEVGHQFVCQDCGSTFELLPMQSEAPIVKPNRSVFVICTGMLSLFLVLVGLLPTVVQEVNSDAFSENDLPILNLIKLTATIGAALAMSTWILAQSDKCEMDSGTMSAEGRWMTIASRTLSLVAMFFFAIWLFTLLATMG